MEKLPYAQLTAQAAIVVGFFLLLRSFLTQWTVEQKEIRADVNRSKDVVLQGFSTLLSEIKNDSVLNLRVTLDAFQTASLLSASFAKQLTMHCAHVRGVNTTITGTEEEGHKLAAELYQSQQDTLDKILAHLERRIVPREG